MDQFTTKTWVLIGYGAYLILLSLVTFILYHADKKKAQKGKWRVPEKVLLLCSFLGGALADIPLCLSSVIKQKENTGILLLSIY